MSLTFKGTQFHKRGICFSDYCCETTPSLLVLSTYMYFTCTICERIQMLLLKFFSLQILATGY